MLVRMSFSRFQKVVLLAPLLVVWALPAVDLIDSPSELFEHRKQLNDTVWKREIESRKYESSIVKLWDDLRASDDPVEVFKAFPIGKIEKANLKLGRKFPERILEFAHNPDSPARRFMKLYEKESLINDLKTKGFSIDQSEWRHVYFEKPENESARSIIEFKIHIAGPSNTLYRRVLTGALNVIWKDEPVAEEVGEDDDKQEKEYYYPEEVTFADLRMYRRSGILAFKEQEWLVSEARRKPFTKVIVEDVDADGLSDVLFPLENRIYFNQGGFRFSSKPFVSRIGKDAPTTGLISDLDLDGKLEYTVALRSGSLVVYEINPSTGLCEKKPKTVWKSKDATSIQTISAGDINGDGYPEIFLGQYRAPYLNGDFPVPYYDARDGSPSFLLQRSSSGSYSDISKRLAAGSKRNRRVSVSSIVDLNDDKRMDLLVTSDFAGIDLYLNEDKANLVDRTSEKLDEPWLFGTSQTFGDFNRDGSFDIFASGANLAAPIRLDAMGLGREEFPEYQEFRSKMSYGNRLYYAAEEGRFEQASAAADVARSGKSAAAASIDFNNDSYPDVYVSNGYISRETANDYSPYFWINDIYDAASVKRKALASYFSLAGPRAFIGTGKMSWSPFQKNALFMNVDGETYLDVAYLLGVSNEGDGRALVSEDFDLDGDVDLLLVSNDAEEGRERVFFYENRHSNPGNWIGIDLRIAKSASFLGAKVRVVAQDFVSESVYVTGQAYFAQTPSRLAFGLGEYSEIQRLEIEWPSGKETLIDNPEINRYHAIAAE